MPRIMEAARDFSHCSAVAVDLVPMQSMYVKCQAREIQVTDLPPSYMPPNLRYLSEQIDNPSPGCSSVYLGVRLMI